MSENGNGGNGESLLGKIVFWVVVAVVAVIVLKLVFAAVGITLFFAFRLLPIVVVAWVLYRIWKWIASKPASGE